MPRPKPFVALHGQVDFDRMRAVVDPVDSDIFVCRQGALGDNVFVTRAQIRNPSPGEQFLAQDGNAAAPGYAFVDDPDTGFFKTTSNQIDIGVGGVGRWEISTNFFSANASRPGLLATSNPSATQPTVLPANIDTNTGLGTAALDELSLIAGGVQVANLTEAAGVVQFIVPLQNNATFPSIAFGDGDTGFFEASDDSLRVTVAAKSRYIFTNTGNFVTANSNRAGLIGSANASDIFPTLLPSNGDSDTGVGHRAEDIGVLVAGAVNCMEFGEAAAAPLIAFYGAAAIALQTGVAVSSAGIHAALVNLGLITA